MPTIQILNLCSKCYDLVKDAFNTSISHFEEKGKCEMCGYDGLVRKVRIDGRANEQTDRSIPKNGVP